MTELVSIILPVLNGMPYLKESVDSVMEQTYGSWELIIVDDGSTDGTSAYLKEIKDVRVRILTNEKNMKLPYSLNRGVEESRGKYVSWTSHDNMYHRDAIEKMVRKMNVSGNDFVYAGFQIFGKRGGESNPGYKSFSDFLFRYPGMACFLWTKKIMDQIGQFDTDLFGIEDKDYVVRTVETINYNGGKYDNIPELLYRYRVHDKSTTAMVIKGNFSRLEEALMDKLFARHNSGGKPCIDVFRVLYPGSVPLIQKYGWDMDCWEKIRLVKREHPGLYKKFKDATRSNNSAISGYMIRFFLKNNL